MPKRISDYQRQTELIQNYAKCDNNGRNIILIVSRYYTGRPLTPAMQHHLEVLGALCIAEPRNQNQQAA